MLNANNDSSRHSYLLLFTRSEKNRQRKSDYKNRSCAVSIVTEPL